MSKFAALFRSFGLVKVIGLVLIIALAGVATWSYYNYYQAQQKLAKLETPEGQKELAEQETSILMDKIRRHMVLPDDEQPTVATVTDVNVLKENQPFFKNAENGDKVLVYVKDRKAIIYSPSKDVVVNVGVVAVDEQAGTTPDAGSPTAASPQASPVTEDEATP